jgi:shikimate dehydrogenase
MGNPVAHSQSPAIHTLFAKQTAQDIRYDAILVENTAFVPAVETFQQQGGRGLNITVPFKQEAWSLATQRSARAELAGAVNTLSFSDGQILGDNTDGAGLVRDLQRHLVTGLKGKKILILGAGGAVRGVLSPLLEQQPECIFIANRTASKAEHLAELFSSYGNISGMGFDRLPHEPFDLIINGTAASLHGDVPAIPPATIDNHTCVYDMMYAALPTAFMQWAHEAGAGLCLDGLGMLVEQAAESFYIWRKVRPDTLPIIENIRVQMQA